MPVNPLSPQIQTTTELVLSLKIPGRTPLLNQLFGMSHWQRAKLKKQIQRDFLSELQASVNDLRTMTEYAGSFIQTARDTPESFQMIEREFAASSKRKGNAAKAKKSTR